MIGEWFGWIRVNSERAMDVVGAACAAIAGVILAVAVMQTTGCAQQGEPLTIAVCIDGDEIAAMRES